jgi:hypothetical protein
MEQQRKKTGPKPKPKSELRQHPITCRVTDDELQHIEKFRGRMTKGEFIRTAALKRQMPRPIPEINIKHWNQLAKLASNINQITKKINAGEKPKLNKALIDTYNKIQLLRKQLIGG